MYCPLRISIVILLAVYELTFNKSNISFIQQSAYNDGRETTRLQLLAGCPALQTVSSSVVDQLLDVWNCVCRRIFSHYRLAARGYFKFLKLAGGVRTFDICVISDSVHSFRYILCLISKTTMTSLSASSAKCILCA